MQRHPLCAQESSAAASPAPQTDMAVSKHANRKSHCVGKRQCISSSKTGSATQSETALPRGQESCGPGNVRLFQFKRLSVYGVLLLKRYYLCLRLSSAHTDFAVNPPPPPTTTTLPKGKGGQGGKDRAWQGEEGTRWQEADGYCHQRRERVQGKDRGKWRESNMRSQLQTAIHPGVMPNLPLT